MSENASESSPPRARQRWSERHAATAAPVYAAVYVAISFAGARLAALRLPIAAAALVPLLTWVGILLSSLFLVLSISRLKLSVRVDLAWMVCMLVLFLLARPRILEIAAKALGHGAQGKRIADMLSLFPGQQVIANIALILWAIFLGRLVSRVIREGKLLLPVAAVASIADIITVFYGAVRHMSEKAPAVVEAFSAQTPVAAPPSVPVPILTFIGIGDFLFLAVFMTILARYAMNPVKATWAAFAAMLVAPVPFMVWQGLLGVPGLPFISAAVLATNWRYLRFTREEVRALAFAAILVTAVAAAAWIILRH